MSIDLADLDVDTSELFVVGVYEYVSRNIPTPSTKQLGEVLGYLRVDGASDSATIVDDDGVTVASVRYVYSVDDERADWRPGPCGKIWLAGWLPTDLSAAPDGTTAGHVWGVLILR